MITIAIDFDGVLNNLPEVWKNYLNEFFYKDSEEYKVEELKYYDMCRNFPNLSYSSIMFPLRDSDFWKTVEENPGASDMINLLQECYKVKIVVVTAESPESWSIKYRECFRRLFPNFKGDDIIVTSHKGMLSCDVLVDDNPQYLSEFKGTKVLMGATYNKNTDVDYDAKVNSIEELQDFLVTYISKAYEL